VSIGLEYDLTKVLMAYHNILKVCMKPKLVEPVTRLPRVKPGGAYKVSPIVRNLD